MPEALTLTELLRKAPTTQQHPVGDLSAILENARNVCDHKCDLSEILIEATLVQYQSTHFSPVCFCLRMFYSPLKGRMSN